MVKVDGDRLRQARNRKLLTLRALAERTGVAHHTIHAIESGKQEPRASTLAKLCDALDIDPVDVLMPEESGTGETGKAAA